VSLVKSLLVPQRLEVTTGDLILSDLEYTEKAVREEKERFVKEDLSEREKGKRLLFLFQRDLMPGINGMILESKDNRDVPHSKEYSLQVKALAACFLAGIHLGMLFYILLFALSQDSHRQRAWGQSFALWLVVEVLLVSSLSVLLMNVLIPSLVMKDVGHIKKKLVSTVISFYQEMAREQLDGGKTRRKYGAADLEPEDKKDDLDGLGAGSRQRPFNSAEYLFVSNRLAQSYPDMKMARMVLGFQTPWPKQSYQHVSDVSKKYDRKFSTLTRSLSIVVLFFLSSLLSVPISVQDMLVQMASTVALGYTILFHLQLWAIFPVLVLVPTVFIAVIVHFFLQSGKAKRKLEEARLIKEILGEHEHDDLGDTNSLETSEDLDSAGIDDHSSFEEPTLHKNRRESLQEGIRLARRLQDMDGDQNEADDYYETSRRSSGSGRSEDYSSVRSEYYEQPYEPYEYNNSDDEMLHSLHLSLSIPGYSYANPLSVASSGARDNNRDDDEDDGSRGSDGLVEQKEGSGSGSSFRSLSVPSNYTD
jgi:hypothetical protein